jgi:hypothetical protein
LQLVNETPFAAGWTVGFQQDGREVVVVVVKATYELDDVPELARAQSQLPLCTADVFGPDDANDAPVCENDFALFKPRCDVLLSGSAYASRGVPVEQVDVGLQIGTLRKLFTAVGPRVWIARRGGAVASSPALFVQQPVSYDVAFGGTDTDPTDPGRISTFLENPVGSGYCVFKPNLDGMPLPLTEERRVPVSDPSGHYRPMALGPLGRNWMPRRQYAGTYDAQWAANKLPFMPDDFDYQYFQAAPSDQQLPYPGGGEPLILLNLTPSGRLETSIPRDGVVVGFIRRVGTFARASGICDTVLVEPDAGRLSLTWRAVCALDRDPFELREIVVQHVSDYTNIGLRARAQRKPYYRNLAELIRARRGST